MCSGRCGFPGWLAGCPHKCSLPAGHEFTCVYVVHVRNPWERVTRAQSVVQSPTPAVKPGSFAELIQVLRSVGALQHISELRKFKRILRLTVLGFV